MSSPSSSTAPSTPTTQRSRTASTTHPSTRQASDNINAAANQTNQKSNIVSNPTDPSERWSGVEAEVQNKSSKPPVRRSVNRAWMEDHLPEVLQYYEDRSSGKIEGKSFEEWGEPISEEKTQSLYMMEILKTQRAFFAGDYKRAFTGRGLSPESLERPGLVGPRNETAEEVVAPLGESTHEAIDRPLWRASDGNNVAPSRGSRDGEDVGPLGELSDDEDVGPFGESRDEDETVYQFEELRDEDQESLPQGHEEEKEVANPEDPDELLQLAATSVRMISGVYTNTGDASSSHVTTTLPTEPLEPLTSSSPPLASTPTTPPRKRGRDSEDDAHDGESSPEQKRMRMDDIPGIVKKDVTSAKIPQNVGPGMKSHSQRCAKRARSLENDSEDIATKPAPKRARLNLPVNETRDGEEEHATAGQGDIITSKNAEAHEQTSVVEEPTSNGETEESDDGFADDEASSTETEWDTAHGINATCANIRVPDMGVYKVTGPWRNLYLPTSTGSPDRAWTEDEKEDLRVYIQDYGVQDWAVLSQSTNRPETELQSMYLEVIIARNKQAGRPDRAGITPAYPDLAPPPPPPTPAASPAPEEPRKLRSHGQRGRPNKIRLGDLTYDVKATSFPKITRDGGMVDAKGSPLYGVMGDISYATKRRQPKPKQDDPNSVADQSEEEESDSEIEEGETVEPVKRDREQGPSPEAMSKGKAPLDMNVEEEEDPEIKQEEVSDEEQGVSAPTAPAAKANLPRHVLGPKPAGVCKLSGSSRRGVPRKAARLRI